MANPSSRPLRASDASRGARRPARGGLLRRIAQWTALVLVGLAGVLVLFFLYSDAWIAREARFSLRARQRKGADYDALESQRASSAAPAEPKSTAALPGYWTDFRGPDRDGVYTEGAIRQEWPASGPSCLWRQPVGEAYSSFVVSRGLAYTLEQRRGSEALVAYDLLSGREVWKNEWDGRFEETMSKQGPRSTPVLSGEVVLALGALGELRCVNAQTGALVWRHNVLEDGKVGNLEYGLAASPLVLHGLVIVPSGAPAENAPQTGRATLLAYDLATGDVAWRALEERMCYASPLRAELAGQEQVVVTTAARVLGVQPGTGAELWSFPWPVDGGNSCSQPTIVDANRLLLSAGYGMGSALIQIELEAGAVKVSEVWRTRHFKSRFNSPVIFGGYAYGLDDGILACLELKTGARKWKGGRYGYGQVLLAGENLVVLTEDGDVCLVRASPHRREELARFRAIEGMTMNVPALAHGLLLVRNDVEMACYNLRP